MYFKSIGQNRERESSNIRFLHLIASRDNIERFILSAMKRNNRLKELVETHTHTRTHARTHS